MHQALKENIENETDGEISVTLSIGGELGAGTELARLVQQGSVEMALFSLGNMTPYADAADLVNLPFLAGKNQQLVNLVTSDEWDDTVHDNLRESDFEPFAYVCWDPRHLSTGEGASEPKIVPSDMEGVKHRINASEILSQMWEMIGANPTPIDWGETSSALSEGVAETLHVDFMATNSFGFRDILTHVTLTDIIPDVQTYAMSHSWYSSLSDDLQDAIDNAGEQTFQDMLDQLPTSRENSYNQLRDSGVTFHDIDESERQQWQDAIGYQRSEWDDWKTDLAGDMETFETLESAARSDSDYDVSEPNLEELESNYDG
nr:TRAP transporter substrate-binding protein [Halalkalicoccus sp. NIPERK01]